MSLLPTNGLCQQPAPPFTTSKAEEIAKEKRLQWRDTQQAEEERHPATSTRPAVILSNVRSLRNKTEELSALIRSDLDCRRANVFCFTETWLSKDVDFQPEGFDIIRFDRDAVQTRK